MRQLAVLLMIALRAEGAASADPVSSVVREAFAVRAFTGIDLPQGSVRAVHVSQRGYLWAGTREGLVRYKSGQQRTWQQTSDGRQGLPSGMVNIIHEDDEGNIWVGTARGVAVLPTAADQFQVVVQSDETQESQLDVVDFVAQGAHLLAISAGGEVYRVTLDSAQSLSILDGLIAPDVPSLGSQTVTSASANAEELFLGTIRNGIYRLRLEQADHYQIVEVIASPAAVVDVQVDADALLWLDRDSGLNSRPLEDHGPPSINDPLAGDSQGYYRAMAASSLRSAWLGAGPNIVRIRGDRADTVRLPGRGNEVRSITVDRAGNIWIGTYYGLFYGLDTDFDTLQTAAAYDSGVIASLAVSQDKLYLGGQNLWVGEVGSDRFEELVSTYDSEALAALRLNPLDVGQNPVTALSASEQFLLVGYFVDGMDVIDFTTGRVTNLLTTGPGGQSLKNIGVSAFSRVSENRWLASFYFYGLVELEITSKSGFPDIKVRKLSDHGALIGVHRITENRYLAVDQKDLLVVDRLADGEYTVRAFQSAPLGIVFAVQADGEGGALLGIENIGVRRLTRQMLDEARFDPAHSPYLEKYLGQRTIWHLLLDTDDRLWATTNNGLYVLDLLEEKLLSHLSYRDGLPSNEFEYGAHASLQTPQGEKLFISSKGPVAFQAPAQARDHGIKLIWSDITLNGASIYSQLQQHEDGRTVLELPFSAVNKGVLQLEYGYDDHVKALDASYAVRYRDDSNWLTSGQPSLTITGHQHWDSVYLEVAMLNSNGAVISDLLALEIRVAPPIYMLGIADLRVVVPLCITVAALLLLVQLRARRRQADVLAAADRTRQLMEAEMRGRLSEKEILLREIQHRVGNIFSSFAASVRIMQRAAASEETRDSLEHLNARIKVQSAVHMLLQHADSTDINVANMIRQVIAGARDLRREKDPRPVDVQLDDLYMTYSKAQYIGLIVNELVTNTYKYGCDSETDCMASVGLSLNGDGSASFEYRDF
ncbi:MAG: two-component sensor histidine kinase/ligand-binding sensor domain-containing protein, partial [Halieaceae bacterium]